MTGSEAAAVLAELREFRAEVRGELKAIQSDNLRGEGVHVDHEHRLRALEAGANEGRGVWRLLTAGGVVGVMLAGIGAAILRSLGV